MDFTEYQARSSESDVLTTSGPLFPLLGLVGEIGELVAEFKKRERDKVGYRDFEIAVQEELGDVLWYAAALARQTGLDLSEIAQQNLLKTRDLFVVTEPLKPHRQFDEGFPPEEQIPRQLTVTLVDSAEVTNGGEQVRRVRMFQGVDRVGDPLDDNSERDDEYRYHDVLHLAHLAVLGWSPVMRRLLGRKRRSDPTVDRIQDGGRAAAIEEGVTAYGFTVATAHTLFASAPTAPPNLLKTCSRMTQQLEVSERSLGDWQHAILVGYAALREVIANRGGVLTADLEQRTLTYEGPAPA